MDDLLCNNCGAIMEGETCPKCGESLSLEGFGYEIRCAERGGGFILYKDGKGIKIVRESKRWLQSTAKEHDIPFSVLEVALITAKSTPKQKNDSTIDDKTVEIVGENLIHVSPDIGVVDGRAYVGVWLPVKITDPETELSYVSHRFYLLFSDGELVEGKPATLSNMGIYLLCNPVYAPARISVQTVLNLKELAPVDPSELLCKLLTILESYIEFDDPRYYLLNAIWVIGTYFYKRFESYPYLFLNAVKRSGKTKLLTVLSLLSYNSIFSPNMSVASLFRLINNNGSTAIFDETEDLKDPEKRADMRSLLLSGYKRGPLVYRVEEVDGSRIPVPYDVYAPKALANISGIEDVLEDRCIPQILKRGKNRIIMNRSVPLMDPIWEELRGELTKLYFEQWMRIDEVYNGLEGVEYVGNVESVGFSESQNKKNDVFFGRDWELWKPLFTVINTLFFNFPTPKKYTHSTYNTQSTLVQRTILRDLYDLAVKITDEKNAESQTDTGEAILMIGLMRGVGLDDWYTIPQIKGMIDNATYAYPEWMDNQWLGYALKRLGFTEKQRGRRGMKYRITPDSVKDMADRLGVVDPGEEVDEE